MPIHDFTSQRIFLEADLAPDVPVPCTADQAHYLRSVLRLEAGAGLLVFNGRDGEWRAELETVGKRQAVLVVREQVRAQAGGPDLDYAFAPLKRARLDYLVQKATELGVARLSPVITQHTVAERVNVQRMRANVVEAAEQCGILRLPVVEEPVTLARWLAAQRGGRLVIFCDETADLASPIEALQRADTGPATVLIGPEGGFSATERAAIRALPRVIALSLGPRIMRADTAAVAALALVNAVLGDWR